MTKPTSVTNEMLIECAEACLDAGEQPRSLKISQMLKEKGIEMDQSTIRNRFLEMGKPLSSYNKQHPEKPQPIAPVEMQSTNDIDLMHFIPLSDQFTNYIERDEDKFLAMQYDMGKNPLTQGKQGTGKTTAHLHYAMKRKIPLFLFSCHPEFRLHKLYGDKTIESGSIKFRENIFVKATQSESVLLFDEINAVENANTFDFHALLQNRELYIKDANDGHGKVYKLHPKCRIGFAMNPRSSKYIGGNVKPSNFLGRCTFITFPEFKPAEIHKFLAKKYHNIDKDTREKCVKAYFSCLNMIDTANIGIDISIRQLINVMDFISNGMDIRDAFEQSIIYFVDAASLPQFKGSFVSCIGAEIPEMLNKREQVIVDKANNAQY